MHLKSRRRARSATRDDVAEGEETPATTETAATTLTDPGTVSIAADQTIGTETGTVALPQDETTALVETVTGQETETNVIGIGTVAVAEDRPDLAHLIVMWRKERLMNGGEGRVVVIEGIRTIDWKSDMLIFFFFFCIYVTSVGRSGRSRSRSPRSKRGSVE